MLINEAPPIIENEVLRLTTFTGASVGDAVKQLRSYVAVPNKEHVVHSNRPLPSKNA